MARRPYRWYRTQFARLGSRYLDRPSVALAMDAGGASQPIQAHLPAGGTAGGVSGRGRRRVTAGAEGESLAGLTIVTDHQGRRSMLRLQGELDVCSRELLRPAIASLAGQRGMRRLILDLSGLTFADCSGLSVLIWAHKLLAERGQELIITGVGEPVLRLLVLTGTGSYLNLEAGSGRHRRRRGLPHRGGHALPPPIVVTDF